jgi:hypothetical protein
MVVRDRSRVLLPGWALPRQEAAGDAVNTLIEQTERKMKGGTDKWR